MKLVIAGGTGWIGTALCRRLAQRGHALVVITRAPGRHASSSQVRYVAWESSEWQEALEAAEAVINLAGEPIVGARWTPHRKTQLRDSRVGTTQRLAQTLAVRSHKPAVLINASAIGYYGPRGDEPLTEADGPGRGFLAELCDAWEAAACRAERYGLRVVRLRIGIVLGPGGGALAKMAPPFRMGLGGPLGSGRQWMSWVHLDDVLGLIEWALATPAVSGVLNATAPAPATMRELSTTLGRVLRRPSWLPAPAVALRLLLGEMADVLLTGQRVLPAAAQRQGYAFAHPDLDETLAACFAPPRQRVH